MDFDVEATYDVVEVRDGTGANSTLLGEFVIYPEFFSASSSPGVRAMCGYIPVDSIIRLQLPLLSAVLTGSVGPAHDLYSTTNQMTVWFFTDSTGHGRGFKANFTSGVRLGSPGELGVRFQRVEAPQSVCL